MCLRILCLCAPTLVRCARACARTHSCSCSSDSPLHHLILFIFIFFLLLLFSTFRICTCSFSPPPSWCYLPCMCARATLPLTVGNLAIEIKLSSPASQFLKPIMKSGHPASQFLYTCVLPSRRNPHPPAPLFAGGGRNFRWWWAMYGGNVATQVFPITMFITPVPIH